MDRHVKNCDNLNCHSGHRSSLRRSGVRNLSVLFLAPSLLDSSRSNHTGQPLQTLFTLRVRRAGIKVLRFPAGILILALALFSLSFAEETAKPRTYTDIVTAAEDGNLAEVKRLLASGKTVLDVRDYGYTALHRAAQNAHNDVVKFLLDNKAPADIMNEDGFTPLHNAAMGGDSSTVKLLVEAGSPVYATDNNEFTPLHLAAMKNNISAATMLIQLGADINVENSRQWTPMRVAHNKGHTEFIEFLQKHGAEK